METEFLRNSSLVVTGKTCTGLACKTFAIAKVFLLLYGDFKFVNIGIRTMRMIIGVFVVILSLFCHKIALAATGPPVPDITNWNVTNTSRIELRISNCASIYIGLEVEYNNPNNSKDFVRVISRHIPLPISKCRDYNELLLGETIVVLYTQKEEQDLLVERSKQVDPFLYVQWQITDDLRTGLDALSGDASIWFMSADGNWNFFKKEKIEIEFLTENVGNGEPHNVFSGTKYSIGGIYHILRVNRSDIIQLLGGEDNNEN